MPKGDICRRLRIFPESGIERQIALRPQLAMRGQVAPTAICRLALAAFRTFRSKFGQNQRRQSNVGFARPRSNSSLAISEPNAIADAVGIAIDTRK
jgi:hypothetical protein